MASPGKKGLAGGAGSSSRGQSQSPATKLTARLGNLVLTEKEASGLVFSDPSAKEKPAVPRWAAIGKVFTAKPLNIAALEKAMHRAWGLHHAARFTELGDNIFMVRFGSEGDWNHAINNRPWQFDLNVMVLREYEGNTRPLEMVFSSIDVWVRIKDMPPDKRCDAFGKALGNWLGEVIKVDVDKDGWANGKYLRVRAKVPLFEPLVRFFFFATPMKTKKGSGMISNMRKFPTFASSVAG